MDYVKNTKPRMSPTLCNNYVTNDNQQSLYNLRQTILVM